jgi:hypothetical protein
MIELCSAVGNSERCTPVPIIKMRGSVLGAAARIAGVRTAETSDPVPLESTFALRLGLAKLVAVPALATPALSAPLSTDRTTIVRLTRP